MSEAAYALFFVVVLLGCAFVLFHSLKSEWGRMAAALRGELPDEPEASPSCGEIHVWERHQPILQPVTISICRI